MQNKLQKEFDGSLAHNAIRLGHLVRRETQRCLAELEITPEQWQILVYLDAYEAEADGAEGLSQNELAELILKDKTTVSRLVETMLKRGLIERREGTDRRTYRLRPSEQGAQLIKAAWPLVIEHFPAVFGGLDDTEQVELLRLLQKVRQSLNDYRL
jgi:DNA-binding MarR family transcriptional regulator